MTRFVFTITVVFLLFAIAGTSQAQMLESNFERAGATYMRGEINAGGPEACWSLCARDNRCKAWTWERPGVAGPRAICSLKAAVTPGRFSPCCVSGLSAKLEQQIELGLNGQPAHSQFTSSDVHAPQTPHAQPTAPAYTAQATNIRSAPVVPVTAQPRRSNNGSPVYSISRNAQPAPSATITYPPVSEEQARKMKASLQLAGE
ncbi:hypothetical protein MNBD_ALPHA06-759 [hydrothermal vent metagenome]|uniref:Apple domain-containing protein n=1 Tax=hydrothermal vent metagenome TaxID=652676 RepID=A0A3B0S6G0_9ZZZZ